MNRAHLRTASQTYLRAAPKAELHVHREGAIRGVRFSFLPESRKREMEATYRAELDRLKGSVSV